MSAEERLVEAIRVAMRGRFDGSTYAALAEAAVESFDPYDLAAFLLERLGQEGAAKALGMEKWHDSICSMRGPDAPCRCGFAFPASETP